MGALCRLSPDARHRLHQLGVGYVLRGLGFLGSRVFGDTILEYSQRPERFTNRNPQTSRLEHDEGMTSDSQLLMQRDSISALDGFVARNRLPHHLRRQMKRHARLKFETEDNRSVSNIRLSFLSLIVGVPKQGSRVFEFLGPQK